MEKWRQRNLNLAKKRQNSKPIVIHFPELDIREVYNPLHLITERHAMLIEDEHFNRAINFSQYYGKTGEA